MNITSQEANGILVLIARTPIKGEEATMVAILQQKLAEIAKTEKVAPKEDKPKEK